ncbi:BRO-N domain-containing protein [Cohaesibacter marisflavi]|uniref:BRO-N domain-containing protein n=1 Tax=Cohaesibacter marisflavi TaxID=655353 RepID=UPI0029C79150|nr:BRO family protein [Cohaesibacter marisflavi]
MLKKVDTTTDLNTFSFQTNEIRVVILNDEPWFVAADVCKALDLPLAGGAGRYLQNIDSDEKKTLRRSDCNDLFVGVRAPSYSIISESGLYKLVMRSDKPQAKAFQDWVTRDVLPAIRKDGMYVQGEEKVATGEMSIEEMELRVFEHAPSCTAPNIRHPRRVP